MWLSRLARALAPGGVHDDGDLDYLIGDIQDSLETSFKTGIGKTTAPTPLRIVISPDDG